MSQNTYPRRRRVWPWILLAAAVALVGLCSVGALVVGSTATPAAVESFAPTLPAEAPSAKPTTAAPAAKPAKPSKPAPPPPATVDDGTWTVGEDIPAGTYKVNQPVDAGAMCFWSITKTGSNGQNIIANDLPSGGRPSVVLKKGQDFETNRCGTWTKTK